MCFFTFDKLCNANVGAADYIALAKKFHTIALSGVPVFTADIRSQAYRCDAASHPLLKEPAFAVKITDCFPAQR